MRPSLRTALPALILAAGCGTDNPATKPPPDDYPRSSFDDGAALAARNACMFKGGEQPGNTLRSDAPLGPEIPIDHFVVFMVEGRSFDHLMAGLPDAGQADVSLAAADVTNNDSQGVPVARFHQTALCHDFMNEGWNAFHQQWDGGKLDGFVASNENVVYGPPSHGNFGPPDGHRAMGYYTATELPYLYALANTFAIADQWFTPILGGTISNRLYLIAGSTFGRIESEVLQYASPTLYDRLVDAKVDWKDYAENFPALKGITDANMRFADHVATIDDFVADAAAGTLPPVAFVDPNLNTEVGATGDSFSPQGDIQLAEAFVARIVNASIASPLWPHMAVLLVFSESGGYYDHVEPPKGCAPDDIDVQPVPDYVPGDFIQRGMRVPAIIISPYARPHYVSHAPRDHGAVDKLLASRFLMPALSARDANADALEDLFDFSTPALLHPSLPTQQVDAAALAACKTLFPGH